MPNYTKNYNLIKPNKTENYDIEDVTTKNMDILDEELFGKENKVPGKGLSTNDFTNEYKNKLDGLENYDDTELINKLNEQIQKNNLQEQEIEELQGQIVNLQKENTQLKDQIPTGQATGNPIHIADSTNLEAKLKLNGGSKQETREGSNLLNFNVEQNSKVTVNADGTLTINGTGGFSFNFEEITLKNGETYYEKYELISGSITGSNNVFMAFNGSSWLNTSNFATFSPTEDTVKTGLWINNSAVFENAVVKIWANTDQSDFEQYGAMPSPDYPSKVETVGSNINLFDKDNANILTAYLDTNNSKIATTPTTKTLYIPCNANTTYTVSKISSKRFGIAFTDNIPAVNSTINNAIENLNGGTRLTQTSTATSKYLCVYYYKSDLDTLTEQEILDTIKIEEGDKATAYSPYGMGSVEIGVCNKNFLKFIETDKTQSGLDVVASNNSIEVNGTSTTSINLFNIFEDIKLKKGTYTFSFNAQNPPPANSTQFILCKEDGTRIKTLNAWGNTNSSEITLEEDTVISSSKSYFYVNKNITFNNTKYELQIEKGESATEIIKPQSQTKIIYTQQEMLEGDYIEDVERHEWGKYVFTGDENITTFSSANSRVRYVYSGLQNNIKKPTISTELIGLLCNYYKEVTALNTYNNVEGISVDENGQLIFKNKIDITVEQFKIWLAEQYTAGTPITIYYRLATPIDLELTEEQKEAQKINTYNNVTNIVADNSLATLDVEYKKDQETLNKSYEDRIAALEAAILS